MLRSGTMLRRLALAIMLFLFGGLVVGQNDASKQRAIGQMRQIANAIKLCAEHESSYQDECQIHNSFVGPPTNVEWDVFPSKTSRSPFQGTIEFTLPTRTEDVDQPNLSKKDRRKCADKESFEQQAAASALAEEMKEGPKWRDGHYRYEFDLGPGAPELIKMLWIVKDRNNVTITSASDDDVHACWVMAAKSAGKAKLPNLSSRNYPQ